MTDKHKLTTKAGKYKMGTCAGNYKLGARTKAGGQKRARDREITFFCFNESPLKMMKNAFYLILLALSVFKIFKFFS